MATEDPARVLTLKERIASLNLDSKPVPIGSLPPPSPTPRNNQKKPPPVLPPRRPLQPISATPPPALPPRRATDITPNRRNSNESISSVASTRSSVSAISARTSLSAASNGNAATGSKFRIKAPEYDPAKLPALPERRSRKQDDVSDSRLALKPTTSAPEYSPRPDQKAILPPPTLPVKRRMPFPFKAVMKAPLESRPSALQSGFGNAASPPPLPTTRPQQPPTPAPLPALTLPVQQAGVIELTANSFDEVVLRSGKPTFVDFYAPFCKYCKALDPAYEELAVKYAHQNITIAKIDSYGQKSIGDRYQVEGWPTLKFFDGSGGPPIDYNSGHDVKWMSMFIDEWLEKLPASSELSHVQQSGPVELDARSFDNVVLYSGKPVFVDFYGTFCKYCKDLDPIYEELSAKYAYRNITIAKIDSYTHKGIGSRYEVVSWPTLFLFDGRGGTPVKFQWKRDLEWMSRFLDEELEKLEIAPVSAAPPPIPMASRPNLAELMKSKPRF